MSEVTRYGNLELDEIHYEKPENNGSIYFGPVSYKNTPLLVQSSKLLFKDIKQIDTHSYIVVETEKDDFSFYDTLVKLDDTNLEKTYQMSEEWFNKELPMDILEGMYTRITEPFKKDTIPSINFRLPFNKNELQTKLYNHSNELIKIDELKKGDSIILMLHIRGLKFLKKNYYCDLYLSQIKVLKSPQNQVTPTICLIDDEMEESNNQANDGKYDYEILDEEIIQKNKEKEELLIKISQFKQKIMDDTKELSTLEEQLQNIK